MTVATDEPRKPVPVRDVLALADLIEQADIVMLLVGERKIGLGRDMQQLIASALRRDEVS